jgi:hypothetical protein
MQSADLAHWNRLREEHMLQMIRGNLPPSNSILVICGADHMSTIADALTPDCKQIIQRNLLKEAWFDHSAL